MRRDETKTAHPPTTPVGHHRYSHIGRAKGKPHCSASSISPPKRTQSASLWLSGGVCQGSVGCLGRKPQWYSGWQVVARLSAFQSFKCLDSGFAEAWYSACGVLWKWMRLYAVSSRAGETCQWKSLHGVLWLVRNSMGDSNVFCLPNSLAPGSRRES
jgi:hypothetical protein